MKISTDETTNTQNKNKFLQPVIALTAHFKKSDHRDYFTGLNDQSEVNSSSKNEVHSVNKSPKAKNDVNFHNSLTHAVELKNLMLHVDRYIESNKSSSTLKQMTNESTNDSLLEGKKLMKDEELIKNDDILKKNENVSSLKNDKEEINKNEKNTSDLNKIEKGDDKKNQFRQENEEKMDKNQKEHEFIKNLEKISQKNEKNEDFDELEDEKNLSIKKYQQIHDKLAIFNQNELNPKLTNEQKQKLIENIFDEQIKVKNMTKSSIDEYEQGYFRGDEEIITARHRQSKEMELEQGLQYFENILKNQKDTDFKINPDFIRPIAKSEPYKLSLFDKKSEINSNFASQKKIIEENNNNYEKSPLLISHRLKIEYDQNQYFSNKHECPEDKGVTVNEFSTLGKKEDLLDDEFDSQCQTHSGSRFLKKSSNHSSDNQNQTCFMQIDKNTVTKNSEKQLLNENGLISDKRSISSLNSAIEMTKPERLNNNHQEKNLFYKNQINNRQNELEKKDLNNIENDFYLKKGQTSVENNDDETKLIISDKKKRFSYQKEKLSLISEEGNKNSEYYEIIDEDDYLNQLIDEEYDNQNPVQENKYSEKKVSFNKSENNFKQASSFKIERKESQKTSDKAINEQDRLSIQEPSNMSFTKSKKSEQKIDNDNNFEGGFKNRRATIYSQKANDFFKDIEVEDLSNDKFEQQKHDQNVSIIQEFLFKNKLSDNVNQVVFFPENKEFMLSLKKDNEDKHLENKGRSISEGEMTKKFKIVPVHRLSLKDQNELVKKSSIIRSIIDGKARFFKLFDKIFR